MATSLTAFYTNLGDLTVSGVTRLLDHPPTSLNSADLPTQWAQFPSQSEGPMTFGSHGGWPILKAQLVIAVASTVEGTQSQNHTAMLTIADALITALRAVNVSALSLGKSKITWTVTGGTVTVSGEDYWAVIADIEGAG